MGFYISLCVLSAYLLNRAKNIMALQFVKMTKVLQTTKFAAKFMRKQSLVDWQATISHHLTSSRPTRCHWYLLPLRLTVFVFPTGNEKLPVMCLNQCSCLGWPFCGLLPQSKQIKLIEALWQLVCLKVCHNFYSVLRVRTDFYVNKQAQLTSSSHFSL